MDYFAHGFWSYILFHKTRKPWIAILLGLIPDSFSWGIYFFYNLFLNGFETGAPHLGNIPTWVYTLYGISHSLFVWLFILGIGYLIFKKKAVYILAPIIAILMDILTHTRDFLPTPFLWPFSDWAFPGISWGSLEFMITNWSVIILLLGWIIWKKYKKKV